MKQAIKQKPQRVYAPYQVKENEGGKKDESPEVKAVKAELKNVSDEIKNYAEDLIKNKFEGKDSVVLEMKNKVDELLTKQSPILSRLEELEQKGAKRGGGEQAEKTIGERFTENEDYKAFTHGKGKRNFHMNFKTINTINSGTGSSTGSAGDAIRAQRLEGILEPGLRRLTVRDLITPGRTNSNAIEYVKETGFQNSAAVQATEGASKAQSDITFDLVNTTVSTIAHFVRASKQILDDAPMMQSYIDGRLSYGLKLVEEGQLLTGSGMSGNLNGIYTQATAYSAPAGITVASETLIDKLRLALLQAELADFPSNGIVLNPINWAGIELTKDSEGRYIIGNPAANIEPRLWNRPVVSTKAMTVDKYLVGAFQLGAQIFDREDANVQVSTEDSDNFTKNLVTIRAEERLALAVYRPEAFIKGDFGIIT